MEKQWLCLLGSCWPKGGHILSFFKLGTCAILCAFQTGTVIGHDMTFVVSVRWYITLSRAAPIQNSPLCSTHLFRHCSSKDMQAWCFTGWITCKRLP